MYLFVKPNGTKAWRFNYRINGKQKTLAIGIYPDISLKAARDKHKEARENLANGIDPSSHKKATKAANQSKSANSFEAVALEWSKTRGKKAESTEKRQQALLRKTSSHISVIVLSLISKQPKYSRYFAKIENRGAIETAHRAKRLAGQVFRYAIATGRAERDPTVDLKDALAQPTKSHFKSITEPAEVGPLILQ